MREDGVQCCQTQTMQPTWPRAREREKVRSKVYHGTAIRLDECHAEEPRPDLIGPASTSDTDFEQAKAEGDGERRPNPVVAAKSCIEIGVTLVSSRPALPLCLFDVCLPRQPSSLAVDHGSRGGYVRVIASRCEETTHSIRLLSWMVQREPTPYASAIEDEDLSMTDFTPR